MAHETRLISTTLEYIQNLFEVITDTLPRQRPTDRPGTISCTNWAPLTAAAEDTTMPTMPMMMMMVMLILGVRSRRSNRDISGPPRK